jgi:hypothetical protein
MLKIYKRRYYKNMSIRKKGFTEFTTQENVFLWNLSTFLLGASFGQTPNHGKNVRFTGQGIPSI